MDRRAFLLGKRSKVNTNTVLGRTNSGIQPYTGSWTRKEVIHMLKRTMFGSTIEDVKYFEQRSMNDAVDELLNIVSPMPSPPLKDYGPGQSVRPDVEVPMGSTWVNHITDDAYVGLYRKDSLVRWWISNMLDQPRNIREKMTLFWHSHFSTEMASSTNGLYAYRHHNYLRENALGNVKQMIRNISIDALMLIYQNGRYNSKGHPDENFARELQELFTLGKENNPNYTEEDVMQVARVLTGWRVDNDTTEVYFDADNHDTGNKRLSSFYNNRVIVGRSGPNAGIQELDDLMDAIFSKSFEASRYIVAELYRWFVYYEIDHAAEQNVILPLSQILVNNNWDVKPVLSALLKSEHFYDSLNRGCLIKNPMDFIIGLAREFSLSVPEQFDHKYTLCSVLYYYGTVMQMQIGNPPSVSGWPATYQKPLFHELWINNDTFPRRNEYSHSMITYGIVRENFSSSIDTIAFAKKLSNPSDPNALIRESLEILYSIDVSASLIQHLKIDILLTGQTNDLYWTNAWNAHILDPSNTMAHRAIETRLKALYRYLLMLSEYQLS